MKFKLFIFLALLFAIFLFSSAAVAEKSKDETKLDATEETNQADDDAKYGCSCCGHHGCHCCGYAEAQLMAAQAKDDKEVMAEELNQQNEEKYQGNGYGGGYGGGQGGGYGGGYGGGRGGGGGQGGGGHGCRYGRCCGYHGCHCCGYAEAQLMGAQAKDDKDVMAKELNQQNEKYRGNGYGGGYGGGRGGGGYGGGGHGGGGYGGGRGGGGGHGGGRGGGGYDGEANP